MMVGTNARSNSSEWANLSTTRMVGSNTQLQWTQWSFSAKVVIWQLVTSTHETIVSNCKCVFESTNECSPQFKVVGIEQHCIMPLLGLWVRPHACIWHDGHVCRSSHLPDGHLYTKGPLSQLHLCACLNPSSYLMERFSHTCTYMVTL
jgi:hypothetical protein